MLFSMETGERLNRSPNKPIIHLVKGNRLYLWVGNNNRAEKDLCCFATLSDPDKLRRLAHGILEWLEPKPRTQ